VYDGYVTSAAHPLGGTLCLDFINSHFDPESLFGQSPHSPRSLAAARRFHRSLQRLLTAEAKGIGAAEFDLATLNRVLRQAGKSRGILPTVRGYGWGWLDESEGLARVLWPVAFSAARLLEGPDLERLKACDGCGTLFLDVSRNHSRRWCDMEGCGNRAKQRKWRLETRESRLETGERKVSP
jgi:predicted RNA-binding Zn ribbon-like protein